MDSCRSSTADGMASVPPLTAARHSPPTALEVSDTLTQGLTFTRHRVQAGEIGVWQAGQGPAALFIHGWPLNGLHWRDSMRRLGALRTCVAPDLMGLGYSEVPEETNVSPNAQAGMLMELMRHLGHHSFDIVANDSGTAIAQIIMAADPGVVRSALMTNGDAHTNSPPAFLAPALEAAKAGELEGLIRAHLADATFGSSDMGLGTLCYGDPAFLTAELMRAYFEPLLHSPKRIRQFQAYGVAFEPNPLPPLRTSLAHYPGKVQLLWGDNDPYFPLEWAHWLHELFPESVGVRVVPGGKLFFTEERPDLVVAAASELWS